MTISMYQASIPVFVRGLTSLASVLKKGSAHAEAVHAAPDALLQQRLIFDMFPLIKQVQIACDTAARSAARLAGVEPKPFPDDEKTLADVLDRIQRAIDYVNGFQPAQIDGSEARPVKLKMRNDEVDFTGQSYLLTFALPNFLFHCTTAYDILRVAGAQIGKRDYLGMR